MQVPFDATHADGQKKRFYNVQDMRIDSTVMGQTVSIRCVQDTVRKEMDLVHLYRSTLFEPQASHNE